MCDNISRKIDWFDSIHVRFSHRVRMVPYVPYLVGQYHTIQHERSRPHAVEENFFDLGEIAGFVGFDGEKNA